MFLNSNEEARYFSEKKIINKLKGKSCISLLFALILKYEIVNLYLWTKHFAQSYRKMVKLCVLGVRKR